MADQVAAAVSLSCLGLTPRTRSNAVLSAYGPAAGRKEAIRRLGLYLRSPAASKASARSL